MKLRAGFFDFTGCEGCQLTVLNLEDEFLDLAGLIDVVEFREVMTGGGGDLDVAFVEGSICGPDQEARLKDIRRRSRLLVALGACADTTGVNVLVRLQDPEVLHGRVYDAGAPVRARGRPRAVGDVVPVDARVPGCPVDGGEFLRVLQALAVGRTPELPAHSVCVECKLAELPCVFDEGEMCLGPVVRAGCGARCPEGGDRCRGCRGLVDNPRSSSYRRVLEEHGLTEDDMLTEFRLFNLGGGGER